MRARLRNLVRRAADRQRLGGLRPGRAEEPPAARIDPGPAATARIWSIPAPDLASSCSTPSRRSRRSDLDPRPCRSLPRHRRSAAALSRPRPAGGRLCAAGDAGRPRSASAMRSMGRAAIRPSCAGQSASRPYKFGGHRGASVDQPHGNITTAGLRFDAGGRSLGLFTDFDELTPDMALCSRCRSVDRRRARRRPHPLIRIWATRWPG